MSVSQRTARRPPVRVMCAACGNAFNAPAHAAARGAKYCSRPCYTIGRTGQLRMPLRERWYRYVEKTRGCWLWTGTKDANGYGRIGIETKREGERNKPVRLAHRVGYELLVGPIPDGTNLCHSCDNPSCVRPDHLFLGDQKANMADCSAKNRTTFGQRSGGAKLTEAEVADIRRLYRAGGITQEALGRRFGVSRGAVYGVLSGNNWRRSYATENAEHEGEDPHHQ